MRTFAWVTAGVFTLASFGMWGCSEDPPKNLAPASSALEAAKPESEAAKKFTIDAATSKATFLMDAPLEKIHGDAPKSVSGEIFVDASDITKSTGLIEIDLFQLTLYQQKRESEDAEYGEREKSDLQNEHVRNWMEIGEDAPEEKREYNRRVQFKIKSIANPSEKNLAGMKGAERKITADVTGEFRLHGLKMEQTVKLEMTFKYDGDAVKSVSVKNTEPIIVDLEKHDVRPRTGFGALAAKTLAAMGNKVAKEAPVSIEFTAAVK